LVNTKKEGQKGEGHFDSLKRGGGRKSQGRSVNREKRPVGGT